MNTEPVAAVAKPQGWSDPKPMEKPKSAIARWQERNLKRNLKRREEGFSLFVYVVSRVWFHSAESANKVATQPTDDEDRLCSIGALLLPVGLALRCIITPLIVLGGAVHGIWCKFYYGKWRL